MKRKRVYSLPKQRKLVLDPKGARRNPQDLKFSLTNTPTTQKTSAWGVLQPYRVEPLFPMVAPRQGMGYSKGWDKNYFLEFAPNVRRLVEEEGIPEHMRPNTKEQFLEDFFLDHGLSIRNPQPGATSHKAALKSIKPKPWEVRERLRHMINEHIKKYKKSQLQDCKYPILYSGEVDKEVRTASGRRKHEKKEKEKEDREKIETARSKSRAGKEMGLVASREKEVDMRKKLMDLYRGTHNSFHTGKAPTCFRPPPPKKK